MTLTTKAVLYYLRRYLERHPQRAARLDALYLKMTGAAMDRATYWRHTRLRVEPLASVFFVYLTFLRRENAIVPNGPRTLFAYAYPELLKGKK